MGEAPSALELVRSIYGRWERGDFGSLEWADPEIEFELNIGLDRFPARGREEMVRVWTQYLRAWEGYRVEADSFHALEDGRVLVLLHVHGRGRKSGIDLGQLANNGVNVFTVRDGRIVRLYLYGGVPWEVTLAELGIELPER